MDPTARWTRDTEMRPYFAGHHVARYAVANGLSRAELAVSLGITPDQLDDIRRCGKPKSRDDAAMIAERFAPAERFAEVVEWLMKICNVPKTSEE
ncbi:hypothetical protein [Zavarzinella formosa]|uniref:hypothetical protein n=1 Tax=Zavarzinella formosa TaxID=360055 RepID=UPI0002F6D772|nr:hypothetical protein [Zavarzinella formosa]